MGGMCAPTVDTTPGYTSTVGGTQIPEWVSQAGQEAWTQAKSLATQPFQPFAGPRIADFSADEQTAFDMTRANQGTYKPLMDEAGGYLTQAGKNWGQEAAEQYMNPYQQNVTDIAARNLNRQFDISRRAGDTAAAAGGAFGGSRHGLLNAENERNRMTQMSDLFAQGQSAAYQNAQTAFLQDQARSLKAADLGTSMAGALQSMGYTDAAAMEAIGQKERELDQASLDTAYQDYLEQREYPYRQINFALGALKGTPYETRTFSEGTSVTPQLGTSQFGQVGGALASLVGAMGLWNQYDKP